jgi:hypothetical protein
VQVSPDVNALTSLRLKFTLTTHPFTTTVRQQFLCLRCLIICKVYLACQATGEPGVSHRKFGRFYQPVCLVFQIKGKQVEDAGHFRYGEKVGGRCRGEAGIYSQFFDTQDVASSQVVALTSMLSSALTMEGVISRGRYVIIIYIVLSI